MSQLNIIDSEGLSQFELNDSPIRFGHLGYSEVATEKLVCLSDGIWLHKNSALAFIEMVNAMHKDSAPLVMIKNGYRSYKRQVRAFNYYRVKKELGAMKTRTREALSVLKNIDPSDQDLMDIIRSNDPMKGFTDALFQKFPKIYSTLIMH